MCKKDEVHIQQLEEENQHLRQLLQAECERLFRYVPLSCGLNAAIMDDWFQLAHALEAMGISPERKGT